MTRAPSLLLGLALAGLAGAEEAPLRGPRGVRDEFLLAQNRLSFPASSADVLPAGRSLVRVRIDWGNDFARDQDIAGEMPRDRRFLVDGEHLTLDLEWRRGLGRGWDAGLRLPLRWRGAGALDRLIDAFHGFTRKLGLPDNDRSRFRRDLFRVEGREPSGRPLALRGPGAGLGNLELETRVRLAPRLSIVGRALLPTGTGPFEADGLGVGLQLVGTRALDRWDLGAGAGASYESDGEVQGLRYARWRAQGFASADWRLSRRFSAIAETTVASRLVTNIERYPGIAWYLAFGARLDLDSGWSIEGGFTENIADQQATSDIGFQCALVRR